MAGWQIVGCARWLVCCWKVFVKLLLAYFLWITVQAVLNLTKWLPFCQSIDIVDGNHLKYGRFENQTKDDHLKTRQVWFLDPHCINFSVLRSILRFYFNLVLRIRSTDPAHVQIDWKLNYFVKNLTHNINNAPITALSFSSCNHHQLLMWRFLS